MVADCFCAPKPDDGNYYVLVHKDGNLQNDHYKNLEWRLATSAYPQTTATTAGKVKLTDGLEVRRNGTIYQKGKKLTVGTVIGNGDMDMIVPIEPFVEYERKNSWGRYERKRISDSTGIMTGSTSTPTTLNGQTITTRDTRNIITGRSTKRTDLDVN